MKSQIIFRDGRRVNLADRIPPALYAELEGTQGRGSRKDPQLFCGGCGDGICIVHGRRDRKQLYGRHHANENCPETLKIPRPMSDEHKYLREYHVLAGVRGGHDGDIEVPTAGRTIVDLVIDGRYGFEVQHSGLGKPAAVDRTARSVAAGLEVVAWCSDRDRTLRWTGYVPGYRSTLPGPAWKTLPGPRTAGAAGISTYEPGERPVLVRGRYQTIVVPRPVQVPMLIDDVVPGIAEGLIRPVLAEGYVRLVRADGIALWEDLTSRRMTAWDAGHPKGSSLARSAEERCLRPPAAAPGPREAAAACAWCRRPLSEEAVRFRLTIHPRCADERATALTGGALWSGESCTRTCPTTRGSRRQRTTAVRAGC